MKGLPWPRFKSLHLFRQRLATSSMFQVKRIKLLKALDSKACLLKLARAVLSRVMGSRCRYLLMHHARHSRLDRQLHFLRPFSRDGQIKKCIDLQGIPCINVKPGAGDDRPNPRSYQKIIKNVSKFVFKNKVLKKLKYLHPIIIPDYFNFY